MLRGEGKGPNRARESLRRRAHGGCTAASIATRPCACTTFTLLAGAEAARLERFRQRRERRRRQGRDGGSGESLSRLRVASAGVSIVLAISSSTRSPSRPFVGSEVGAW